MKPYHLSDDYWAKLSERDRGLYLHVRPLPQTSYTVDYPLHSLESFLADVERDMLRFGGSFELNPDFQRGHVWTDAQRQAYIESLLRNAAPRTILFNCPGWMDGGRPGDIPKNTFQCIDGLQRLTAMRRFMADEVTVFGGETASSLRGTIFSPKRVLVKVAIYEFPDRAELLQFYLDLNAGGTVHTQAELDRVRDLRDQALAPAVEPPARPRMRG